jgi:hypothetical protein
MPPELKESIGEHGGSNFRFAARIARMDQTVAGHGFVGFDLAELDWERTRPNAMQPRLRASRHRPGTSPPSVGRAGDERPFAEGYLRDFRSIVAAFAFDQAIRAGRNVVERCFNRLKQFRDLATRYSNATPATAPRSHRPVLWLRTDLQDTP